MRRTFSRLRSQEPPARRRDAGRFAPAVEALERRDLLYVGLISFCQSQLGLKVGSGECAALASEGLRLAGDNFIPADPNNNGDYQWGTLVGSITPGHNGNPCQVGDVLQFTNVQIAYNGTIFSTADGHHTAIVAAVDANGQPSQVYEQNASNVRTDQLAAMAVNGSTLLAGEVDVYQPVAFSPPANTTEFAVINDTAAAQNVTVAFNGTTAGTLPLTAINTAGSYLMQEAGASGPGTWTVSLNGTTVNVSQAGGYEVYTAANGQASLRPLTYALPSGPQVIASAVDSNAQGAAQGVILTFNEAILASSFTTAGVDTLTGPAGAITPTGVSQLSSTQYEVTFAAQSGTGGTYTLTVGPNITDAYGDPMNQNGNGVNGESPGDDYTTTFALPMPQALPVSDTFADGVAHDFISQSGTWSVSGGRYAVTPYAAGQDAVSLARVSGAWPSAVQLNVTMNATAASGGFYSNGFVVFDYQSPTNFKFAGAYVGNQQWVIGHRDATGWEVDASAGDASIAAGTDFNLQLMLQGTQAALLVNGSGKVAFTYSSAFTGATGLGTENSVTQFGGFMLQQVAGATLPYSENFSDGQAHYFVAQEGGWSVSNSHYVSTPVSGGDTVSTLLVNGALPPSLEFDVAMSATAASGGFYSNGFLIFDYQSPTNFKYAGAFVGNQQWVIGHRDAAGWHNDAATGDAGIAASTSYNLQLFLQGGTASLLVNGVGKVGYGYGAAFTGSLGLGTENSVTQFTNLSVQAAGATLPYSENFSDGQAHYFVSQEGNWSVANNRYISAPVNGGDTVSALLVNGALPYSLEFDIAMSANAATGGLYSNGFVIFDYQSPTNFKFAGAFVGNQQWVIGHRDSAGWHTDSATSDAGIAGNTSFNLQLFLQGGGASLVVNGVSKVGYGYGAAFTGSLGLGTENSISQFTNLSVQAAGATLPYAENFSDGQAHYFLPQSGSWAVSNSHYSSTPVNGGDALTELLVNGAPPSNLALSATMSATAASGGFYSNGFLIFDYQSPTNFKFAGAFVGNQQWVIGHRDATGWHIDAAFSDASIAAGTTYSLELLLQGSTASLLVGGVSKVSHSYSSTFTGSLGLGTENSVTQFGSLSVQQAS